VLIRNDTFLRSGSISVGENGTREVSYSQL
jgi:hypothetical protein